MTDLSVEVAGVSFANPVLLASGTCNYGEELEGLTDLSRLGGLVSKTITPRPRSGNPPPRLVETAAGMLNSIGLQNPGLEAFVQDRWPRLQRLGTRVVVNIAGDSASEFAEMAARLEELEEVTALELNISCPNLRAGGMLFGTEPRAAAEVVAAVRRVTRRPVVAKLTPNVTDVTAIARAVVDAGADAVSLINTLVGMAVDLDRRRPALANVTGGLSGPAIKPVALAMVWKVHRAVSVPVIGIGGIATARDALEFMVAGASLVQVGTASFTDPNAGVGVVDGMRAYCASRGIPRVSALIGSLQTEN